jgi:hypothetical protein
METNIEAPPISGIKAGEYGIFFCDRKGNLVDEDQISKRLLHVTEMTNPETYRSLVEKKDKLRKEFQKFIDQQEKAGLFPIPCLGGDSNGEIYPQIIL